MPNLILFSIWQENILEIHRKKRKIHSVFVFMYLLFVQSTMDVLKLSQNYKKCVREYCKHKGLVFISIVKYDTQSRGEDEKNMFKENDSAVLCIFQYFPIFGSFK